MTGMDNSFGVVLYTLETDHPGGRTLMATPHVKMYTLSTCHHCKAAKKFLAKCGVEFEYTDVDQLTGPKREATLAEVRRLNPEASFPTILVGDQVIVGHNEEKIRKALGL
jgi:glutaredoxin